MRIIPRKESLALIIEEIETVSYGNYEHRFCMRNNGLRSIEDAQKEIEGTIHDYDAVLNSLPQSGCGGSVFVNGYHWKWTRYSVPIIDNKFSRTIFSVGYIAEIKGYIEKSFKSDIYEARVSFERSAYYIKDLTMVTRDIVGIDSIWPISLNQYFMLESSIGKLQCDQEKKPNTQGHLTLLKSTE